MKDPERLLNAGATDEERLLLSAAAGEEPHADGAERLRVLLGLSGAALASGAAVASAQSLPPAAAANAVLTTGKTAAVGATVKVAGAKLVLPWLALALTGAGIATGVFVLERSRSKPQPQLNPRVVHAAPVAPPAELAPPEAPQAHASDMIDIEQAPRESDGQRRLAAKATPKLAHSIARETADLDAARAALREGSAPRALKELDRYMQAHPRGVLRQEASVLRIEALLRSRDVARGKRTAQDFLHDHPDSPYAARVRTLLDDATRPR